MARDYERKTAHAEAMIDVAMIRLMAHLYRSTVGELSRAEPVDAVTFADVGTRLRWGPKAAQDTAPPGGSTLSSRSRRTGRGRGSAPSDRHRPLPKPCASIPPIRGRR